MGVEALIPVTDNTLQLPEVQGAVTAAESGRVDDARVHALVVGLVKLVDHLAFNVRMKNLHLKAMLNRILADVLVVLGQFHRTKNIELHLAAHIHAGAMDD